MHDRHPKFSPCPLSYTVTKSLKKSAPAVPCKLSGQALSDSSMANLIFTATLKRRKAALPVTFGRSTDTTDFMRGALAIKKEVYKSSLIPCTALLAIWSWSVLRIWHGRNHFCHPFNLFLVHPVAFAVCVPSITYTLNCCSSTPPWTRGTSKLCNGCSNRDVDL